MKLIDRDGNDVSLDGEGELVVKGPTVMRGYLDSSLDAAAFVDGWLRTGDLARFGPHGEVIITGRVKDIIIRKGENISAKEIEDLLYTHPKVAEVAVIGLPDRERGERVCAVVQLAGAEELTLAEVVEFCKAKGLMMQKVPEQVELVTEFPRGGTGKINKRALQDELKSKPWP